MLANEQWDSMLHALGGGPNLVTKGQVDISPIEEGFGLDISGKNPRTAVCLVGSDYEKFLMITVDGRTEEGAGMALAGEAELLIRLGEIILTLVILFNDFFIDLIGCYDGMNLDGGGSTTMWTELFGVMNTPSDLEEREIPTALGIYLI